MASLRDMPKARTPEVLEDLRRKGVRLWATDETLHYQAPKGILTELDIEELRKHKAAILNFLKVGDFIPSIDVRSSDHASAPVFPLSFSQLAHWNAYRLPHQKSWRLASSVLRLRGNLDVACLRESLTATVQRHDALRTRMLIANESPMQEVLDKANCDLEIETLTSVPPAQREACLNSGIENFLSNRIDVTRDHLFKAQLFKIEQGDYALVLAMEHLISDGASIDILLRDLLTAYRQQLDLGKICLPGIPVQFPEYAFALKRSEPLLLQRHGNYWRERLWGCSRVRFPMDTRLRHRHPPGWGIVRLRLGSGRSAALQKWCREMQSTLVISAFTAYAALVLQWCEVSDGIMLFQIDGRSDYALRSSIGYFAFPLYLRVQLGARDTFRDLLQSVTAEYCRAYEHADYSYLQAQVPAPEFTKNTCFNWVPQASESVGYCSNNLVNEISVVRMSLEQKNIAELNRDTEPMLGILQADNDVQVGIHYPTDKFSVDTMESFGEKFLEFVDSLLYSPHTAVRDITPRI